MKLWIRKHFFEIMLNTVAFIIFVFLLYQTVQVSDMTTYARRFYSTNIIGSPLFRSTGVWAFRFFIVSLAMSPIYIYFNWKPALRLRKPAGLWAFAFAAVHVWLFYGDYMRGKIWVQTYPYLGLYAFAILAILTLTSHRFAMRLLGKNWKRLHRLVYVAATLIVVHGLLAASHFNKSEVATRNMIEMRIYLVIVIALLVVRIPFVRTALKRPRRKEKAKRDFGSIPIEA